MTGEDLLALLSRDLGILRPALQNAQDVHFHAAFIGAESLRKLRVERALLRCHDQSTDAEESQHEERESSRSHAANIPVDRGARASSDTACDAKVSKLPHTSIDPM